MSKKNNQEIGKKMSLHSWIEWMYKICRKENVQVVSQPLMKLEKSKVDEDIVLEDNK